MKTSRIKKAAFGVAFITLTSLGAMAQIDAPATEERKTKFSVEVDPSTFALRGYGLHLRVQPKNSDHFLFGAGTYALDFPKVLVNLNELNRDAGWYTRLKQGYGLFTEYHFSEVNRKWYVGTQVALQQYQIQKDYYDGESKFSNILVMGLGGYTLQPFDFDLYFKFWGGIGYTKQIAGDNFIGNATYDVSPILLFGALHLGYTF